MTCGGSLMTEQLAPPTNGGSIPTLPLQKLTIHPITLEEHMKLVNKWHYSKVKPRLTKLCLGGFNSQEELVISVSLGWGVRPIHTIKKLFPSLETKDYYEIGKLCANDSAPKNTESMFLGLMLRWLKRNRPHLKVIFTWADGIWGKPGYIYQASNFLYGGFIWTDRYINEKGLLVHPRQLLGARNDGKKNRPSPAEQKRNNWKHIWGKQFRYVYFLSDKPIQSNFHWDKNYPKNKDIEWYFAGESDKKFQDRPAFVGSFQKEQNNKLK